MNRRVLVAPVGDLTPGSQFADVPESGDTLVGPSGSLISLPHLPVLFSGGVATEYATIAAALAAASAGDTVLTPPGAFTERLTVPSGVNLYGPMTDITSPGGGALTDGAVNLNSGTCILNSVTSAAGESAVVKPNTSGTVRFRARIVTSTSGSIGLLNISTTQSGVLLARVDSLYVGPSSFGVGAITQANGHTHFCGEDIYLSGNNAVGVVNAFLSSTTEVNVQHILLAGAPSSTTALSCGAGRINARVQQIIAATATNVAAAATISLFYNQSSGLNSGAGTLLTSTPS